MERNFSAADGRCALITHNKNNSMRQLAPSFHCFLLWFLRFRCFALLLFSLSSRLFFISLIIKEKKRKEKIDLAKLGWLAGSFFWVGYGAGTAQGNKPKEETSSQPSGMKNKFN